MEDLKNLNEIHNLLAEHPIYTYDYTDGLYTSSKHHIKIYPIDLSIEDNYFSGCLLIYPSEEILFQNLKDNIDNHMDLTAGADDQYYDYSPSQVEAILFGMLQLTPEHQEYIVTELKKHLKSFIEDEEQDEDMISQYTDLYNAIKRWESNHKETEIILQLEISNLLEHL